MRQYSWDEYYEKFYDWAESTQVRNLSALCSLGSADEVAEIIAELQVHSIPAANRLLKRAVEEKLMFTSSDLIEFLCVNDKALATAAVYNSAPRFTDSDMEDLYGEVDDEVIVDICTKRNLLLPEDLREEDNEQEEIDEDPLEEVIIAVDDYAWSPPKKPGFFTTLFGVIAGVNLASDSGHRRHTGHCNGDCANCPPHYGYRYGRWYYGHDHVHGCEFGGNKSSGSTD